MQVISPVLTIFLLMAMGFAAVKLRLLDSHGITSISTFVLYFAQPCLIISKMEMDATPSLLAELGLVFVLTCVIMTASGLAAWRFFRKQGHDRRAVLSFMTMAGNCGFMGYPVIGAVMGEDCIIYAVLYVSAFNVMCWTLGAYFYAGPKAVSAKQILINPSIWAVAAGFVLLVAGWRLPEFIHDAADYMGSVTTPAAMFVIGARLVNVRRSDLADRPMLCAGAFRIIVVPLIVLAVLKLLPVTEHVRNVLYICSMMPGASLCGMMADLYDCEADYASRSIAVSTAFSLITVPILLLLL